MALFSNRKAGAADSNLIEDRCWNDPVLDQAVDAVKAGQLPDGYQALVQCQGNAEERALRSQALGGAAARFRSDIEQRLAGFPDDPDLNLWLGRALLDEAWGIRGGGWAETLGHDRFLGFQETLERALTVLRRAADLAPADPVPVQEMQWCALGLGLETEERNAIWDEVLAIDPVLYPANVARLNELSAKWYGSHELMFDFAREAVQRAPEGNPLTSMLPRAHFEWLVLEQHNAKPRDFERTRQNYFTGDRLVELTSAETKWLTNRQAHPRDLEAHQLFAGAFLWAGRRDRALWHLSQVGNRVAMIPWSYQAKSAASGFAAALQELKMPSAGAGRTVPQVLS